MRVKKYAIDARYSEFCLVAICTLFCFTKSIARDKHTIKSHRSYGIKALLKSAILSNICNFVQYYKCFNNKFAIYPYSTFLTIKLSFVSRAIYSNMIYIYLYIIAFKRFKKETVTQRNITKIVCIIILKAYSFVPLSCTVRFI